MIKSKLISLPTFLGLLILAALIGCGGGGSDSAATPATPATPVNPVNPVNPGDPALNVKISQIEACPRANATVYVSVTDQDGYAVTTLTKDDFEVIEQSLSLGTPTNDAPFVENNASLSVALVMDYSNSIRSVPANVAAMEAAATSFIGQLGINDEAEIIKYGSTVQVAQAFTDDQIALEAAITTSLNVGDATALYDAVVLAVDHTAVRLKDRRAVIVITDGKDSDGTNTGTPGSLNSLVDLIDDANDRGVPVFTVGLGTAIDIGVLEQMADDTGGTFSNTATSGNLLTIYNQLADLLFTNQYILTYNSGVDEGQAATLNVVATDPADPTLSGDDIKAIPACP